MLNYQKLIEKSKSYGFSDIQINENTNESLTIYVSDGAAQKNNTSKYSCATIKGVYNQKVATIRVEDFDMDEDKILTILKDCASHITSEEVCEIFGGSESYPVVEEKESDYANYTTAQKIEKLVKLEKNIKAVDKRIVKVPYCVYMEGAKEVKIINSKGLNLSRRESDCAIMGQAVAIENGQPSNGGKMSNKINFEDLDFAKVVNVASKDALDFLNAKSMPSGIYDCIIENEAMNSLFSTFENMFNGEAALHNMAFLAGKEGQKVMNEMVTIIDDPLIDHPEVLHKIPFDSEGVACYTKDIIKNGVFKGLLHNLKTAKAFNATSTGNAYGNSVGGYNTYIAPGTKSKEELIATIEKGVLVKEFDGLHAGVNPISGDFNLKCAGFVIENGKITRPVTLIVMAGNFYKMFNDKICEIGNDLTFARGSGAPSIKFKSVAFSGE